MIKVFLVMLFLSQNIFAKSSKIIVCGKKVEIEIADTSELREKGLMFRKEMPKNSGMLFVYDHEEPLTFWMKNTYLPLSIGFFDKNKKLINTLEMKPLDTTSLYSSKKPAQYALEMNKGWFTKNKVDAKCSFEYDF